MPGIFAFPFILCPIHINDSILAYEKFAAVKRVTWEKYKLEYFYDSGLFQCLRKFEYLFFV